jgi:hypothetical protein
MLRKMPRETTRTSIRWLGLSLLSVGVSFWGCGIDEYGTLPVNAETAASSGSGDVVSSSSGNGSSSTSASSSNSSSGGGQGGGGQGGQGGMGGGPTVVVPRTCKDVLEANPNAKSGTYTIDIDGDGPQEPFSVVCQMLNTSGWTLVALEKPNNDRNLILLGLEKGTPEDLVAGENAIIGARFAGIYSAVRIEWDTNRHITFDLVDGEIFEDTKNHDIKIANAKTSENTLTQWLMNGAKFCRATSQSANSYPGDSSWAIKPAADNNTGCGCNGNMWSGQGAFYGGTGDLKNYCGPWKGGFAGVKDDGDVKSETVPWYTRMYIL